MSGTRTIISGELSQSKGKGKAFVSALNNALSPAGIVNHKPNPKQELKSKKK